MLYFAWGNTREEALNAPLSHEMALLQLNLRMCEGEPPHLKLKVEGNASVFQEALKQKLWGALTYEDKRMGSLEGDARTSLFCGQLHAVSHEADPTLWTLTFKVPLEGTQESRRALHAKLTRAPFFDACLDGPQDADLDWDLALEGEDGALPAHVCQNAITFWRTRAQTHPCELFWHPTTGAINVTSTTEGAHALDLVDAYDAASLSHSVQPHISEVFVTARIQWVQLLSGIIDLTPAVEFSFKDGFVNTYTPFKHWPYEGQDLGNGYSVIVSRCDARTPPLTLQGGLREAILMLPQPGPGDNLSPQAMGGVPRFWYDVSLWVYWTFQQKREETLTFTLSSALEGGTSEAMHVALPALTGLEAEAWHPHNTYPKGARVHHGGKMWVCTQDHCSHLAFEDAAWSRDQESEASLQRVRRSCFFGTEEGVACVERLMQRASAKLQRGGRCVRIRLRSTLERCAGLTVDHQVSLVHPRLGSVSGKVIELEFFAEASTREVWVTLACLPSHAIQEVVPVQIERNKENAAYALDYVAPLYCVASDHSETPEGVVYARYDAESTPKDAYAELEHCAARDMLRSVEVAHPPEEQRKALFTAASLGNNNKTLASALRHKETQLNFYLRPLRSEDVLRHEITVTLLSPYILKRVA